MYNCPPFERVSTARLAQWSWSCRWLATYKFKSKVSSSYRLAACLLNPNPIFSNNKTCWNFFTSPHLYCSFILVRRKNHAWLHDGLVNYRFCTKFNLPDIYNVFGWVHFLSKPIYSSFQDKFLYNKKLLLMQSWFQIYP